MSCSQDCNQGRGCTCAPATLPGPLVADEDLDIIAVDGVYYWLAVCIVSVISVAIICGVAGFIYQRWFA